MSQKNSSLMNCSHDFIKSDGTCGGCGMAIQTFYNTDVSVISNNYPIMEKGLMEDMKDISITEDVKNKANEIYKQLKISTHRGNKRKLLVFFCIYNAYLELGNPKEPKSLAKLVGIKPQEITKSLSLFCEAQTGYHQRVVNISPLNFIPEFCSRLKVTINEKSLLELAKRIIEKANDNSTKVTKNRNLNDKYPQNVAAGIIKYFMNIYGIKYDKSQFSKDIEISETTITDMYKLIAEIDNC